MQAILTSKSELALRRHAYSSPSPAPRLLRRMPGYEVEERIAINAYNAIVRIYGMTAPPDLDFVYGMSLHYDPNYHTVRLDLREVRQLLRVLCDDYICVNHAIAAFMAHEMRHSMQPHSARDTLVTLRYHEDDADFHIGVVLAHLGLNPAEVEHIMVHLGGPGNTEHSPGPRRAALVWAGYDHVLLAATA